MSDEKVVTPPKPYVPKYDSAGRVTNPPTADQIAKAVSDIEKRWGLSKDAVLVMMHNHIFGATTDAMLGAPTADAETIRRRRRKHRQQQHHHMLKNPQGLHAENPSAPAGG